MKLSELIENLQKAPGDAEVINAVIEFAEVEVADTLAEVVTRRLDIVGDRHSVTVQIEKTGYEPGKAYLPPGSLAYKALAARSDQLNKS